MGHTALQEMLIARWTELVNDATLHDLPYKIELNQEGKIEMSPANNRHGMLQGRLARTLGTALPGGEVITECSVLTDIGVRVPDVAWASNKFLDGQQENTPFTRAPEICVEIVSPSNSRREIDEKIAAYLAAGAEEVWVVDQDGNAAFWGAEGKRSKSAFNVTFQPPRRRGS
jgi:Uma2 family endonuclease